MDHIKGLPEHDFQLFIRLRWEDRSKYSRFENYSALIYKTCVVIMCRQGMLLSQPMVENDWTVPFMGRVIWDVAVYFPSAQGPCAISWPLLLKTWHRHLHLFRKSLQSHVAAVRSVAPLWLRSSIDGDFFAGIIAWLPEAIGSAQTHNRSGDWPHTLTLSSPLHSLPWRASAPESLFRCGQ